ncbi:MAG TPA: hypothetical protein VNM48_08270 [Chloroflexota bacterium]|nr:hypothetical protein [Chloroflexota bacterium]
MMPHLYLSVIVVSATVLGACLASMWWEIRARRREAKAYDRGWVWGRIGTAAVRARQVDAGCRAGWVDCDRDYIRRAPANDVARRVLALQVSRN